MDIKAVERIVGKIQTTLFKNSNAFAVGMLRSHFKGAGLQFKEHQVYNPGDEVRFIDWKLSAKTTTTYIKTFEEERNVEIHIIIDLSQSMFFGYNNVSKIQASLELASLLFLLADETKDKVKVILVGETVYSTPPLSGKMGIVTLIALLEKIGLMNADGKINLTFTVSNKLSIEERVSLLKAHLARKKEVVLFSDMHDFIPLVDLKKLAYRKNLHCFRLVSPLDLTQNVPYAIWGKESGETKRRFFFSRFGGKMQKELLPGKITDIDITKRYLEEFVKKLS